MIFFLYGKDDFSSSQKLKEIVDGYKKVNQTGLNLRYFDFTQDNFEEFRDQLQARPMFKDKNLFVLKNIFSKEKLKEQFLAFSKNLLASGDIIVFYEKGEVASSDPLFSFLLKNGQGQEFTPLKGKKLKNWTEKEFAKHQLKITPEALEILIEAKGNDPWQLAGEIQKLACHHLSSQSKEINEKDVSLLINLAPQNNIFKTLDFIAGKEKAKATFSLHQHLNSGESPFYLLAMIASQFRKLLIVKEKMEKNESLSGLKWSPFVIQKTSRLARQFSLKELKKIYHKIVQIDLEIKTGKIDPELALDLFIASGLS